MADEIDMAFEREAMQLSMNIAKRKPEAPAARGECFTCNATLPPDHRWCDAECRDEYEKSFLHYRQR